MAARPKKTPKSAPVAAALTEGAPAPLYADPGPGVYDVSLRIGRDFGPDAYTVWEGIVQAEGTSRANACARASTQMLREHADKMLGARTFYQVVGSQLSRVAEEAAA